MRTALLALLAAIAAAATGPGPRLSVGVEVRWQNPHGLTPLEIVVESGGERILDVVATHGSARARERLVVGRGRTVHHLLLPVTNRSWSPVHLTWTSDDGRHDEIHTGWGGSGERPPAAIVLAEERRSALPVQELAGGGPLPGEPEPVVLAAHQVPRRWQAWPGRSVIVVEATAWQRLDPAQRTALGRWARAGGDLVTGYPEVAGAWRDLGFPGTLLGDNQEGIDPVAADDAFAQALRQHLVERPLSFSEDDPETRRVPDTEGVPASAFSFVVLCFALLVGPANLWWVLYQRRRRALFLITTPLIAGATCLVLVVVNLLAEGITTRRLVDQLWWLDQVHQEAVVVNAVTWFAPFAPGSFTVDQRTAVTPLIRHHDVEHELRSGLAFQWGEELRLGGAWIPARRNRRLLLVEPQSRPERLRIRRDGDRWRVVNGLGTDLAWLTWRDADGQPWTVEGLADGAEAVFVAGARMTSRGLPDLDDRARVVWSRGLGPERFQARASGLARPVPGPPGRDALVTQTWICGHAPAEGVAR